MAKKILKDIKMSKIVLLVETTNKTYVSLNLSGCAELSCLLEDKIEEYLQDYPYKEEPIVDRNSLKD